MSLAIFGVPVPSGTVWCCSGDFSVAMEALVAHSAHNVGITLGVLLVLGY